MYIHVHFWIDYNMHTCVHRIDTACGLLNSIFNNRLQNVYT